MAYDDQAPVGEYAYKDEEESEEEQGVGVGGFGGRGGGRGGQAGRREDGRIGKELPSKAAAREGFKRDYGALAST